MTQTFAYPPVTDELLHEIVARIKATGNPLKIVLFGSHARGDARLDSDLDILIVEESDVPRYQRGRKYRLALLDLHPSKDIVVWTPSEIAEWANVPNAFVTTALREGKILYERSG